MEEKVFKALINLIRSGCTAQSSAKSLGINKSRMYSSMTTEQRAEFDYEMALQLYRYDGYDNYSKKPKSVKKIEK